jgi:hypothetical protein
MPVREDDIIARPYSDVLGINFLRDYVCPTTPDDGRRRVADDAACFCRAIKSKYFSD